ncbi:TAXI family TRAP transporter solute-binding subunit [Aeromonas cavernicola]|uniref:TRAP transporter substrate-binding protein n=1 Tax=Aeromonas cavernicola TaxID=1006623 RepID=A0A2H9U1D4_9GAMM|nr:TAXI family TRAP transporter solute-binding subunit [Aeromonas cavernicola]PJG57810.1 TRAP transporter substrate-binding protein [Aeromonas cavernicola]
MNKIFYFMLLFISSCIASERLYLGTGDINGIYYQIGGEFCRLATNSNLNYRCAVVPSSGSIENLSLLENNEINFAIVQSDWVYQAYQGIGPFKEKPMNELRAIFATHAEPFTLVVKANADINSVLDLKNKKIYIGMPNSGTRQTAINLFSKVNLSLNDLKEVNVEYPSEALCKGAIDAFAMVSGHPNKTLVETTKLCDIKFIAIDKAILDKLMMGSPFYQKSQIPPRLYPGNIKPIPTFAVAAILVTSSSTNPDKVYALTKGMLDQQTNFNKQTFAYANLFRLNKHRVGKVIPIEQHPGAKKYFDETK